MKQKRLRFKQSNLLSIIKNKSVNIKQVLLCCMVIFMSLPAFATAQKVSVEFSNVKVEKILSAIAQQTGLDAAYSKQLFNTNRIISINMSNVDVTAILDKLVAGTNLTYEIKNNKIYFSEKKQVKETPVTNQTKKVSGIVTDAKGEAVIGANIVIKGTTNGTITDLDGKFAFEAPANATLLVSFIGYTPKEIQVTNQSTLAITLAEDSQNLDEVVVIGYGTQRKGNIATSVSVVKSEALQNRPVPTLGEALQGQVPGLSVTSSSRPGKAPSIQLRGATSLNGGGSPLVLVDGVPSDFNYLNPEDIESINVLKDAASAAIYGSRAANGVLLVTTKRGKTGKPTFRYNGSVGVNTPTDMPEYCSSAVYVRAVNEAEENAGRKAPWTADEIALFENGTDPNRYPNTNWLDHGIKNSITTRHGLEASGGNESVKYLLSAGMDYQTGVFPENTQNIFNVRSNTDIAISRKLNVSFDIRYQLRSLEELANVDDAYKQLLAADPTMVAFYTDGTYGYNAGFFINPLVNIFESGHKFYDRHDASGIFKFDYEIIDGLKFTGLANVNYVFGNTSQQSKKLHYKEFFTQKEYETGNNALSEKREHKQYFNLQALLTYQKTIGKHSLDVLAGYQQENEKNNWISAGRSGYPTDLIWVLNAGPKDNWSNDGNAEHWSIASVIGRLNYDYASKYMLSASFRSDASSRFAKANRWSTFPSVAAAWRISQESFMEGTSHFIDDLKIRASWGQNGASTGLGLYPSYTTIAMDGVVINNTWMQTAKLKTIGNQDLGWERTEMFNIGLDFRTLEGRLGVTGEYYVKKTKDILIGLPVPLEYGFGKPNVNIGKMENRGWEIELKWNDQISDFKYEIAANLSDNKNEVLDLGGTGPWKDGYTDVGLPFKSLYGYEALGLFQSDEEVKNAPFQNSKTAKGDVRYKDQNDDKKIDANDRVIIGDPYPHLLYGIRLNGEYKGFDLSMFFQGVANKDKIFNDVAVRPMKDSPLFEHQLDYWSENNKDAKYPRIMNKDDGAHNYQTSDFWKINAGYLRMKNLQIGYSIPKKILAPSGFNRVRAYFSVNNLFTVSNFVPGWDPESDSSLTYPFSRTYSFGLNVQF